MIGVSLVKDAILEQKTTFACIVIGIVALAASFLAEWAWPAVFIPILICGAPIVWGAIVGVVKEHDITADVLVSVAIVASVIIGEYDAAAEIAIIMQIGGFLEEATVNHANASIMRLVSMRPATARVVTADGETTVPIEEVRLGDTVRVVPGEIVPVDGTVSTGHTSVNNSILTGESVPIDVGPGDRVSSGTVNMYGSVDIEVDRIGEDSTIARMTRIIENADAGKSKVVRTADRWAVYIVVIAFAVSILAYLAFQDIYRSVTVLVVFCPCALILATPTAIMAAAGNMSKRGILVKDGGAVERMASVDTLLMDKTGTVTTGNVVCHGFTSTCGDVDADELSRMVSAVESRSEHPLGRAISSSHPGHPADVSDFEYIPGRGVSGTVDGHRIVAGNEALMAEVCPGNLRQTLDDCEAVRENGLTVVLCGIDGRTVGYARLSDTLKEESVETMAELRAMGVRTIMLTGDNHRVARRMADELGMDDVRRCRHSHGRRGQRDGHRVRRHRVRRRRHLQARRRGEAEPQDAAHHQGGHNVLHRAELRGDGHGRVRAHGADRGRAGAQHRLCDSHHHGRSPAEVRLLGRRPWHHVGRRGREPCLTNPSSFDECR